MKKIFFFYLLLLLSVAAKSQDIIIKKSGDEIKVKVLEIGISEIKYKRFDFQDGPIYTISKSEVILVRYENGINEVITSNSGTNTTTTPSTTTPQTVVPQPTTTPVVQEKLSNKIEFVLGSYSQNNRYISKTRVLSILSDTKDLEILQYIRKSKRTKKVGTMVSLTVGLPFMVVGSLVTLAGIDTKLNAINYNPDGNVAIITGVVMAGTGLVVTFANIGFQAKSRKMIGKALAIYNSKYADKN